MRNEKKRKGKNIIFLFPRNNLFLEYLPMDNKFEFSGINYSRIIREIFGKVYSYGLTPLNPFFEEIVG